MQMDELMTQGDSPSVINYWLNICVNRMQLGMVDTMELLYRKLRFQVCVSFTDIPDMKDKCILVSWPGRSVKMQVHAKGLADLASKNFTREQIDAGHQYLESKWRHK